MALEIPVHGDQAHYNFQLDLPGGTYTFELNWNDRAEAWFCHISDNLGNMLIAGLKIVLGIGLTFRIKDARLFVGEMFAIDETGQDLESGYTDFGDRVKIVFLDANDITAAS